MKIRIISVPKWHKDIVKREAERAKAAFEALSPEEQTAVMQRAAQEEALNQQQSSPEEVAMMQQQQMEQPEIVAEQPNVTACGGKLNKFDGGGEMKKKIYSLLGINTDSEFNKWAKDNNVEAFVDRVKDVAWDRVLENDAFVKALTKDNPALAHAISKDYDFGVYQPAIGNNISFDDNRGNWDAQTVQGWWGSNDPAWKQVIEAHPELTEDTNLTREELADYIRNTDAFKKGTKWLQDSEDNRLAYLQRIINNTNAPRRAREYALRFADANGWKQNAARDYETIFNNPSGRAANPGTYWKTPIEVARGSQTGNFVINDDGTVEPIIGDVPADWTGAGNYSWATPESDYVYNYYRRPAAAADAAKTPEQKAAEKKAATLEERRVMPIHKNNIFGIEDLFPAAAWLKMDAGVGEPKVGMLNSATESAGNVALADWMPRGDFAVYRKKDPWFYTMPIIAQSNATQRAIANKVSPSKGAETLANSYATIIGLGNAQRGFLESDINDYLKYKQYNGTIYGDNQKEYGTTSRFNAGAWNDANKNQAHLKYQAAETAMDALASFENNRYKLLNTVGNNIAARRKENRTNNMIADMAATGMYGVIDPDRFNPNGMLRWETDEEYQKRLAKQAKQAACGGKLKKGKKRGLTF